MATITTDLICNLNQPVAATFLHGNLFSQDNAGNTINVHVMENGEPATIGGTVSANVIRADGNTVAVSGSLSGNQCSVVLPQACYAVPGRVEIIIKLTQSTTITTIAAIVANVYRSTTDTVVDPGTIIPSIQALIEEIEDAVDSIPVDYSGLLATIAADYSSSKTYPVVGMYAWQGGVLKRNIVPITTAETYTAAHWTNAVIGDDLSALKSALSDRTLFADTAFSESIFQLRKGSAVNSIGRYASDSNAVAGYGSEKCPFVYAGTKITANDGYKFSYALWDIPVSASASTSHNIIVVRDIAAGTTVTIPQDAYIAFSCKKADDSALPSDKTAYEFANEAVTVELYIRTSKTEINKMEEQIATHEGIINAVNGWVGKNNNPVASLAGCFILSKNVCKNTDYTDGYYIKPDGSLVANASFKVSDYFMVEPNTQYYLYNSSSTIVFYDFDKNYIWGVDKSVSTTVVTSPANACFARYSTGGAPATWNVSKGTDYIDTPYFEPYLDLTGFASSPYYKGRFNVSKPDVHTWYECECLKDNYNAFDFHLGSDTAYTGTQYADVLALLDELVSAAEPGYITKTAIGTGSGTDINGNPYTLYEYAFVPKAYSASLSNKKHPKILLDCAIHGFEKNTTFGIFSLLYDVVHNWQKNSFLATLRHFVEIRWVPVSDPYGFDNNIRNNANGVNLNRNFPADGWTPGSGINYGGESPLDQPEAAALAAWFQANPDMLFYINFHVNGHYYSEGYNEANACMPYTNIGDDYYNKLFNAIKRHIERQTAELPTEFDLLTPSHSQFIGQLQASETSTSGYVDQYVCAYLKSALAMTIEGCNYLRIDSNTEMSFNTGTIKMNAEMFGNIIEEILYEYLD